MFSVGQVGRKPVGRSRGSRARHVGRTCEHVQSNRWVTALVNRTGKSGVNIIRYPRKLQRPDRDKLKESMTKFQRNAFVDLTAAVYTTFVTVSTRFAVSIIRVTRLLCEPENFLLRFRILFRRVARFPVKLFFSVMFHVVSSGKAYIISNRNKHPNVTPRGGGAKTFPTKSCSPHICFRFHIFWCKHVFLNAACPRVALAALAGSQLRSNGSGGVNINNRSGGGQQTHEMTVPNDLIGCIIGKGGTKIAEIR